MSDGVHLLIPFAGCNAGPLQEALTRLALPGLDRLLARMAPAETDLGEAATLSPPHERALARALGLPLEDGRIPWAARLARRRGHDTAGKAWATITPCHWKVETDHIRMGLPFDLQLSPGESRVLLHAMRPYFEGDGITLIEGTEQQWLAHGPLFEALGTASLDRVVGRTVDDWLPREAGARTLRRLQQEMQMLLYTHAVNDARAAAGKLPVNSFWVSGTGTLPPATAADEQQAAGPRVVGSLREPALRQDAAAWAAAWAQLDSTGCAALLADLEQGRPVRLTLCGERHARSWQGAAGRWQRMAGMFGRASAVEVLESL